MTQHLQTETLCKIATELAKWTGSRNIENREDIRSETLLALFEANPSSVELAITIGKKAASASRRAIEGPRAIERQLTPAVIEAVPAPNAVPAHEDPPIDNQALAILTPKQIALIHCIFVRKLSPKQAMLELHLSRASFYERKSAALRKLRRYFDLKSKENSKCPT